MKIGSGMRPHHGPFFCEPVPGTGRKAIITSEDSVPDRFSKLNWNGTFQFDGEIGNAASGVELEGRGERVGGTGGEAARAGTAAVFLGLVRLQIQGGEDFPQKQPVAESAADEVGVFADKPDACPFCKLALEHRSGVRVPKGVAIGATQFPDGFA